MSEWKECKLGDVINFGNGKSRPNKEGTIPIYGGNGILDYCDQFNYNNETIIIGRVGAYCGSVYYENKPIWVSDNALSAKPKEGNDTKFVYYFLKNLGLNQFAGGSSHPLVTQTLLNSIDVEMTENKVEQRAIASVLSSLDDKIDLLHRQNKTLEAMADTLFRQWFVEEAEEGWESKISELPIKIIDGDRGKNYPKKKELFNTGDCLFLSAKNVTTNGFNFNQCQFITSEKDSLLRSGKLKRNDIIITTRGTVGNIAYYDNLISFSDVRINSGMIILRTEPSVLDPIFVFCLISSNYFMYLIENQTSGSAQPQMPIRDFKQIEVLVPPKEKIDDFLTFAKPCLNKKFNNDSQIRTLEKLRDTLLPKLMSGEVRVQLAQGEAAI